MIMAAVSFKRNGTGRLCFQIGWGGGGWGGSSVPSTKPPAIYLTTYLDIDKLCQGGKDRGNSFQLWGGRGGGFLDGMTFLNKLILMLVQIFDSVSI
jgi:hypothetical protein